jgi:hypothetical protein
LPAETVLDGEVVALDETGKPSFNKLQNFGSSAAPVFYFVFDVLVLAGRNVMGEPFATRRTLLEKRILPRLADPVRQSPELRASLADLIHSVKAQGLESIMLAMIRCLRSPALISSSIVAQRLRRTARWKLFSTFVFCSNHASMDFRDVRRWGTSQASYFKSRITLSATASWNL